MPDPTKTAARRPGPGDLVSITNDLGFGANVGDVGRIRAGDKADPCPYCDDDDCREWPNVDLLDGRTVYHVPECAMETINDPTKTAADHPKTALSIQDMSFRLNVAGYVWVMQNYLDGTYWAVVRPLAKSEWIGDDLGYNFDGERYGTPEEALAKAAGDVLS